MRYEPQGLERYADTDSAVHCNTVRGHRGPTWQSVWIYLLRIGDEASAQLVRDLNAAHSDECHYQDHDYCHYPSCECVCHKPRESMALVPYDPRFGIFDWSTVANAWHQATMNDLAALRRQTEITLSCVREAAEVVRQLTRDLEAA